MSALVFEHGRASSATPGEMWFRVLQSFYCIDYLRYLEASANR